jgi:hypothetical protein
MTSCVQCAGRINLLLLFVSKLSRDLKMFVYGREILRPASNILSGISCAIASSKGLVEGATGRCRTRVAKSIFADLFMKVSSLAQVLRVPLVVSPLIRCKMKNCAVDRGRGFLSF